MLQRILFMTRSKVTVEVDSYHSPTGVTIAFGVGGGSLAP